MQSKLASHALDQIAAIFSFANGAGRHGHDFLGLPLLRRFLKSLEDRDRAVHRVGGKPARRKAQPAKSNRFLQTPERGDSAIRIRLGDDHVNAV
jgi:hypothetical protein